MTLRKALAVLEEDLKGARAGVQRRNEAIAFLNTELEQAKAEVERLNVLVNHHAAEHMKHQQRADRLAAALNRAVCWTVAAGLGMDDDAPMMPEWRADADAALAEVDK